MRTSEIKIPIAASVSELTLSVRLTGLRVWRARLWLGSKVLMLGAAIIGCSIEITGPEGERE
tara:strand:+ start:16118 stop:16303 length:186 start_codon:yes stop_codon:yes gene_type:complete